MSENTPRILVARPDRVGDVILSTPVFQVLKDYYPNSKITVLVQAPVAPLLRGLAAVDDLLIYEPEKKHAGLGGFFRLMEEIRNADFSIGVVLQSNWRIAAALFGAGVPNRVGPVSKPHSYLFYNRGIRQHRSRVEMHETDYNLQLLRKLGVRSRAKKTETAVYLAEATRLAAGKWLEEKGWNQSKLIVVHPGMGGSALNWPENHYVELVKALVKEGHQILLTGGPTEGQLLSRIAEQSGANAEKVMTYGGPSAGPIDQLAGLMSWADVVVAPSTGPLHLAVALGKPVLTFYPPIRVQSAIRWGPYRKEENKDAVLVPEVYCGQEFKCIGNLCNYYPCMKSLTVQQALEQVHRLLALKAQAG